MEQATERAGTGRSGPAESGPAESGPAERRRWMAVLARGEPAMLETVLAGMADLPGWRRLRGPEIGMVMVRGRIGGGGARFNLGEMTVTRCAVRTQAGRVGHAYIAGRVPRHAELAALADALMQDGIWRERLEQALIGPLARAQRERRDIVAAKTAATRIEFFTLRTMR